jgi:biopolymer transport protein ExbB/TolQ
MWEMLLNTGLCGLVQVILGILGVGLIIERFLAYSRESTHMESFIPNFEQLVQGGQHDAAIELCRAESGHIPEVFALAVEHRDEGMVAVRKMLASRIELQILPRLRRRMVALSTLAKTEPMLGLLGTVQGMIQAFDKIAGATRVDPSALAKDIGLALGTTLLGLIIAIPLIYFLAYFRSRVQQFELDLELYLQRCLELVGR